MHIARSFNRSAGCCTVDFGVGHHFVDFVAHCSAVCGQFQKGPSQTQPRQRKRERGRRDDVSAVKQVHTGPSHPHGREPGDVTRLDAVGASTAPHFPGLYARCDGCRVDVRQRRHRDLHGRSGSHGRAATSPPLAVPRVCVGVSVRCFVRALVGAFAARACCGWLSPTGRSAASRKSRAPAPAQQAHSTALHRRRRRLRRRKTGVSHPTSRHAGVVSPAPPTASKQAFREVKLVKILWILGQKKWRGCTQFIEVCR